MGLQLLFLHFGGGFSFLAINGYLQTTFYFIKNMIEKAVYIW